MSIRNYMLGGLVTAMILNPTTFNWAFHHSKSAGEWFIALFIFRYLRFVVHLISFWYYKPSPVPVNPTYTSKDCTVLIPTVEPEGADFKECIQTCLLNQPSHIVVVTVGAARKHICSTLLSNLSELSPSTTITLLLAPKANKRIQVATAIPHVQTELTVLLDDHVFWPSPHFLRAAIAPFEDPSIGAVATNKRVRKTAHGFSLASYLNMLGALYLERHNFEIRATNAIDGGVFVVSGRTSLHRTAILQSPDFQRDFIQEKFLFGLFGPLNADDDNYITRFEIARGWGIKVQYTQESLIETTLAVGQPRVWVAKCLRWVRTTWRSNSASLFTDRTVWRAQPWCVYAVYWTSFCNFALFNDVLLIVLLAKSVGFDGINGKYEMLALGAWMLLTKMVKITAYFLRHPADLCMLGGYFAFAYFHSLLKLWALLTFWDCSWGGRDLDAIDREAGPKDANGSKSAQPDASIVEVVTAREDSADGHAL